MNGRRTAVVTGASRGIGRAVARRLAASFDIVAVARSERELRALARDIEGDGGRCTVIPLNISDAAATERALGSVDAEVLVNNAGVGMLKPLLELSLDEWHRMVGVNFNALFYVTRVLLPKMVARGSGDVINIGSLAGRNTFAGGTCYTATKHAVIGFTESLMLEVRDSGVRVSVIMPGSVATDFFPPGTDVSWMLTPEQVAESVAHLIDAPRDALISRVEMRPAMPPKRQ
jgi:short-subunit dehydrogenase